MKSKAIIHIKAKQNLTLNVRSEKGEYQPLGRLIGVAELTFMRPAFNTKIRGS